MQEKSEIRRAARRVRAKLAETANKEEPASLACHFFGGPLANWSSPRKPVVAGYWPYGTEFDVRPLLNYLYEAGHTIVLPVADAVDLILHFRVWTPDMDLAPDALGIKAPPDAADVGAPDIILAPLLAFTARGDRIGYGAGYYDATLHSMRSNRSVVAVGIGWAAQEVPEIPASPFDEPLDWIVTETYARLVDRT
jgi:5-formyltetrahydrofolate cyclo-ligase